MTGHDQTALLRELIEEVTERPVGDIGPDTRITDLGVDSVAFAEIVVQIEDGLDIDIPFARWLSARTVRDVLAMIDEVARHDTDEGRARVI